MGKLPLKPVCSPAAVWFFHHQNRLLIVIIFMTLIYRRFVESLKKQQRHLSRFCFISLLLQAAFSFARAPATLLEHPYRFDGAAIAV